MSHVFVMLNTGSSAEFRWFFIQVLMIQRSELSHLTNKQTLFLLKCSSSGQKRVKKQPKSEKNVKDLQKTWKKKA